MSYLPNFSHIYIESQVKGSDLASQCIKRFPRAKIIEIIDYKSIFNRPNQDFQTQKKSTKLILAKKNPPFIYPATDILQDGGFRNFYYTTPVINCIYNCDYCFLQGIDCRYNSRGQSGGSESYCLGSIPHSSLPSVSSFSLRVL